jgi:hypothetical protein|nr:MAG TPA: hypothetical protein [Caudoviricetes sp.]
MVIFSRIITAKTFSKENVSRVINLDFTPFSGVYKREES